MFRTSAFVLMFGSLLFTLACHSSESHEHGHVDHAAAAKKSSVGQDTDAHSKICKHHIEEPFDLTGHSGGAGAGIVFGTADFSSGGGVVIKIEVEDTNPSFHTATVTVWSGTTQGEVTGSSVPSGAPQVFTSGSDVNLRYWTTHLDRSCPLGTSYYWLLTQVAYRKPDGSQETKYFFQDWHSPAFGSTTPDPPHDFGGL